MKSLGERLKAAREASGFGYDHVSRETNIAIRYLEALEREDFSVFPGEPYLLGFLKNYGEYLDLDTSELLSLYRALKIQEQPIPVEQLLHSPSPLPKILLGMFIGLLILGAVGGGVFFGIRYFPRPNDSAMPVIRSPVEYTMNTETLERRFYRGDSIIIPAAGDRYKLEFANLGETVTLSTPGGTVILGLGEEKRISLNLDGTTELRIIAADFAKNDPRVGALMLFEMNTFFPALVDADALSMEPAVSDLSPVPAQGSGMASAVTVFSSPNPYPFTLQTAFQGYCMFRYEILAERDRRDRFEQYMQRSEELSIQAQNGIRIWASNAQMAKAQVIGGGRTFPLELGVAGEVVVVDVRWVQDTDGRFRLVMVRLE